MLLAIDIGNTHTVCGLFEGQELIDSLRIVTDPRRTADEHALMTRQFLGDRELTGIAVASVVPQLTEAWSQASAKHFQIDPYVITARTAMGVELAVDVPDEVGPDRIANTVAAHELASGAAIVVDFGTATVFDAVSESGAFCGGAIIPGVEISLEALYARAARLNPVDLVEPKRVIATSTADNVRSGVLYGYATQADGMIDRFRAELPNAMAITTGGLSSLLTPHMQRADLCSPALTLRGIQILNSRAQ